MKGIVKGPPKKSWGQDGPKILRCGVRIKFLLQVVQTFSFEADEDPRGPEPTPNVPPMPIFILKEMAGQNEGIKGKHIPSTSKWQVIPSVAPFDLIFSSEKPENASICELS